MEDYPEEEVQIQTEAESLRVYAKNMGLKIGNLQDVDKLKALIAEKSKSVVPMSKGAIASKHKRELKNKYMKLVRIRLTPMSPFERQLPSTTIDVGNSVVGKVKRTIQFNEPWHVEEIVLSALKEKKFRSRKEHTDPTTRRKVYTNTTHASYGIEMLPDLTTVELKELSAKQLATGAID